MLRLLIADDEKIIRETISHLINWEELGIELIGTCKDGIEAYEMILDEYPDLVLTDIKMPGLSGLDLISKVQNLDKRLEFILLSGYSDFSFAQEAMSHGVKHYLLKPCNENQIIKVMQSAISDVKNRREKDQLSIKLTQSLVKNTMVEWLFDDMNDLIENPSSAMLYTFFQSIEDIELAKSLSATFISKIATKLSCLDQIDLTQFLRELYIETNLSHIYTLTNHQLETIIHHSSICKYKSFIEKTLQYVDSHLEDPTLSLKGISENYLYMNVDYVSKQFIKQTGDKFSVYVTRKRIETAKKLLLQSGAEKIYMVAEQVGCGNNPHYFSQIFKKYTGMTPTSFIKKHSNL